LRHRTSEAALAHATNAPRRHTAAAASSTEKKGRNVYFSLFYPSQKRKEERERGYGGEEERRDIRVETTIFILGLSQNFVRKRKKKKRKRCPLPSPAPLWAIGSLRGYKLTLSLSPAATSNANAEDAGRNFSGSSTDFFPFPLSLRP
jgi:hypothetical protein